MVTVSAVTIGRIWSGRQNVGPQDLGSLEKWHHTGVSSWSNESGWTENPGVRTAVITLLFLALVMCIILSALCVLVRCEAGVVLAQNGTNRKLWGATAWSLGTDK